MFTSPELTSVQRIWLAFLVGVAAVAVVVVVIADVEPTLPVALPAALAATMGGGALLGVLAIDRIFAATPPTDDTTAWTEYRTRLVLQAVLAETAVLGAVVVTFFFGPGWIAGIGGLAGVTALLVVRPSLRRLARFDAAWRAQGSDVSLLRAAGLDPASGQDPR